MKYGIAVDGFDRASLGEDGRVREETAVGVVEDEPSGLEKRDHRLRNVEKRDDRVLNPSPVEGEHEILESVHAAAYFGIGGVLDSGRHRDVVSGKENRTLDSAASRRGTARRENQPPDDQTRARVHDSNPIL
jgi:hypothetical protein